MLVPHRYGGFPSFQFSSPHQTTNRNYYDRNPRQGTFFFPHYPTQPFYQPPYYQDRLSGVGSNLESFLIGLDNRYRQEQYMRKLNKLEKLQEKLQVYNPSMPMYSESTESLNYNPTIAYEYEKETQFVPMPIFTNPYTRHHGYTSNIGINTTSNLNYNMPSSTNLPPKIRVIFIPTGESFLQQPCTGPLAMPPFLYNRISQPLCSFPLPPPLPQLGSLPLTPPVQQMVVQRYSNPIAVLPFTFNWQSPQMIMPNYPQMPLCQPQQPIASMPNCQPYSMGQQFYAASSMPPYASLSPSVPIQSFSTFPAAPPSISISTFPSQQFALQSYPTAASQPYVSAAPQSYPTAAPQPYVSGALQSYATAAPQPYVSGALQSYATAVPQPYVSAAPQSYTTAQSMEMPMNISMQSQSSFPLDFGTAYPSICRACPPAPPPLNIPVTGHCWVQHCAACHNVPTSISNPNTRPTGERITPLLRHPTVPQYIPDQSTQQGQYHQNVTPFMSRPWLRKTPPLPPGAILISDEYINEKEYSSQDHSKRKFKRHHLRSQPKHRSTTVASRKISTTSPSIVKVSRSVSLESRNKVNNNSTQHKATNKRNRAVPKTSSGDSSSGLTVEYQKVILHSSKNKEKSLPQQLAGEARSVNILYNYQPQELPSVYLLNRYLKSSSEASTVASNIQVLSDFSSSPVKEQTPISSPLNDFNSAREESKSEKEDKKLICFASQVKKPKERLIIIRESVASSPSTMSTISSNTAFSIIAKDRDTRSKTS